MIVQVVLADTGRAVPGGASLNLLNAGWTATMALPHPEGGYMLPSQAIAVFVQAEWNELNRPLNMIAELVDDENHPAEMVGPEGLQPVRVTAEVQVPPVPGAPNGTPGHTTAFVEWPAGSIRIRAPRHRYIWRVTIGDAVGEAGFWVQPPPPGLTIQ